MIIDLSQPEASLTAVPARETESEPRIEPCSGDVSRPASTNSARRVVPTALAAAILATATSASAAIWNGGGSDSFWSSIANWDEGNPPDSSNSADFTGNAPFTVDVDTSAQASALNFDSPTSYSLEDAGGDITLSSGDIDVLSGSHSIQCDVSLDANGLWSITGGEVLNVSGVVSGSHSLTKGGNGTLTLSGTNSYTGGTALIAGTLAISSGSNLGTGSLGFGGNATLNISDTFSTSKGIGLASSQNTIDVDGGQTLTVNGVVSGTTGTFAKSGGGTLELAASNTFGADVSISSGTLRISSGANLGNTAHTLYLLGAGTLQSTNSFTLDQAVNVAGGSVAVAAGKTLTLAGNVSGSGILTKIGAGTLELAGGSSVGAGNAFNITAGTLLVNSSLSTARIVVGANGALAGGGSTAGNVTVQPDGVVSPGNSIAIFTISGSLTNAGTYHCELSGTNADTLVVSNNLSLAGSTLDAQVLGSLTTNRFVIATYGTLTGTFATVSNLPASYVVDYAYFDGLSSNNIALVIPPGSDDCASAPVVSEGTYSGNNTLATHDGTSSCDTSINSRDVWFVYKASSNGVANARTGPGLGTDFDTVLTVFDGCGGTEIIANDDAYNDGLIGISEVSWEVTAGQTYWIRVAGNSGATGNYALEIRVDPQPSNDYCANALPVTDGTYMGTTVGTTTEGMLGCSWPETHDVWFVYTNPEDCAKDVTFSTCNGTTDFDTVLWAYDGCGGSLLGSNDDGCAGPNPGASTLTRTVQPFASVWIRLNGYASATGQYQLDVSSVYNPATFCAATLLHWPLDEGSGTNTTESVSGETNVAHLVGDATWTNGIAPGSTHAVHFSNGGTGWIDAGTLTTNGAYVAGVDPGYKSTGNQWTMTAWVKLNNPQATVGRRELIGSATGVANWWNLGVQDWAATQEAITFDFLSVPVHATNGIPLGQPVFLAVLANNTGLGAITNKHRFTIWDGTSWRIEDGTDFVTLGLAVDIGSWREGVDKFDGIIDDVRIFDRVLTQSELETVAMIPPTLVIAPAGVGSNSISWAPNQPGFMLQESPTVTPAAWTNSPTGSANPVIVPSANLMKFYRLMKP